VLALATACTLNLPPIRLEGTPADLRSLEGQWVGEYASDDLPNRGGTIVFVLAAKESVARGDVLMTPRGASGPLTRRPPEPPPVGRVLEAPQSLAILFVRSDSGSLVGELDRYWDPDLKCLARTTFEGSAAGDVIRGTYETAYSCPLSNTHGHWRVTRLRTTQFPSVR
jgi:hypothetical protein